MPTHVELYHPELGVHITASESAAQVHIRNGWEYAEEAEAADESAPEETETEADASAEVNDEKEGP